MAKAFENMLQVQLTHGSSLIQLSFKNLSLFTQGLVFLKIFYLNLCSLSTAQPPMSLGGVSGVKHLPPREGHGQLHPLPCLF